MYSFYTKSPLCTLALYVLRIYAKIQAFDIFSLDFIGFDFVYCSVYFRHFRFVYVIFFWLVVCLFLLYCDISDTHSLDFRHSCALFLLPIISVYISEEKIPIGSCLLV